jgi:Zn-dependent metalloprotease
MGLTDRHGSDKSDPWGRSIPQVAHTAGGQQMRRPVNVVGAAALAVFVALGTAVAQPGVATRAQASDAGTTPQEQARQDTVAGALEALRANAGKLGFALDGLGAQGLGADYAVTVTDVVREASGASHVRMERTFRGLPVIGGDFVVHRSATGEWAGANATFAKPLDLVLTPAITAVTATASALAAGHVLAAAPQLVVFARGSAPRLAWDVFTAGRQADGVTPSRLHTYVDAMTGRTLGADQRIMDAAGSGRSLYSGTVPLDTTLSAGWFELKDLTRGGGFTADAEDRTDDCLPIAIPICTSTAPATLFTDKDNKWGTGGRLDRQTVAVDAQYGSNTTWDYFKNVHGRSGVANDGLGVYSRVHYGRDYANAFWNDECLCMTFGDGDGKDLGPLVSLDITGHEISHGMTSRTAKLAASGESGGINEASSDIFGTMIEFYANNGRDVGDYLIGETSFVHKKDGKGEYNAIRYMDRPSRDTNSPDCWSPGVAGSDVHLSAGIANHFFYLLSEGSGKKTVNGIPYNSPTCDGQKIVGIGNAAASKIWYRALTLHMTSGTNYSDARLATKQAAAELFGKNSKHVRAVEKAWDAVNVHVRDDNEFL